MRLLCQIISAAAAGTTVFFLFSGLWAHATASLVCAIAIFLVTPGREE